MAENERNLLSVNYSDSDCCGDDMSGDANVDRRSILEEIYVNRNNMATYRIQKLNLFLRSLSLSIAGRKQDKIRRLLIDLQKHIEPNREFIPSIGTVSTEEFKESLRKKYISIALES